MQKYPKGNCLGYRGRDLQERGNVRFVYLLLCRLKVCNTSANAVVHSGCFAFSANLGDRTLVCLHKINKSNLNDANKNRNDTPFCMKIVFNNTELRFKVLLAFC